MSRIVDINDLVDESSGDDSDDDGGFMGHNVGIGSVGRSSRSTSSGNGGGTNSIDHSSGSNDDADARSRRVRNGATTSPPGMGCRQAIILMSLVAIIAGASVAIGYAVIGSPSSSSAQDDESTLLSRAYIGSDGGGEQKLLEIAERVVVACSETNLDSDMSDCRALCRDRACCFDDDADHACVDDESWNCAAYAGCANLLDGVPMGVDENEEDAE
jgi:hypothetical protein